MEDIQLSVLTGYQLQQTLHQVGTGLPVTIIFTMFISHSGIGTNLSVGTKCIPTTQCTYRFDRRRADQSRRRSDRPASSDRTWRPARPDLSADHPRDRPGHSSG